MGPDSTRSPFRGIGALLLAACVILALAPQSVRAAVVPTSTVSVATKPLPPLVTEAPGGKWKGFSIDLWNEIARRSGYTTRWVGVTTVGEQIESVASGVTDAAIAGISITRDRESLLDFTQPYLDAGLQIAVPANPRHGFASFLDPVRLRMLWNIMVIGGVITLLTSVVIWLVERRRSPDMPERPLPGIATAFWWSVNLFTAKTYGDGRMPPSAIQRLLSMVGLVAAVVLIAQFTASITASLTLSQLNSEIRGPSDLRGKRVVVLSGTTGEAYVLDTLAIEPVASVKTLDDAVSMLVSDKADALVYDAPALQYLASRKGSGKIALVGQPFQESRYGIALQQGSPLREEINGQILAIIEDGTYDRLYEKWFGVRSVARR